MEGEFMLKQFSDPNEINEIIETADLVVALFSDLGCNVCLAITPDLEEMSEVYNRVKFISADVEAVKALVGKYLVFVYPTIIIFAQGKETRRFERVFSLEDMKATIQRLDGLMHD